MLFKKKKTILIIFVILLIVTLGIYYFVFWNRDAMEEKKNIENESTYTETESENNKIVLPTTGNDMVIKTKSKSTIRVINEFDESMFKGKKSILFMWGSWCGNCATEMSDLKKILDYYKNTDIHVVFVSHDFDVQTLITYVERDDVDFDTEILLDLGRVIRAHLDPDASTVPVTYFLDENVTVKYKYDTPITFNKVKEILNDLKWN